VDGAALLPGVKTTMMNNTNTRKEEEVEVSLDKRQQGVLRVTSVETLVDPIIVKRKPGPANKTRPERLGRGGGTRS
jgi:hypothetical protein